MLAQADVAVVEPHHPVTCSHQGVDQIQGPGNELHAQAHDEQHHLALVAQGIYARASVFDFDFNAVGFDFHGCKPLMDVSPGEKWWWSQIRRQLCGEIPAYPGWRPLGQTHNPLR